MRISFSIIIFFAVVKLSAQYDQVKCDRALYYFTNLDLCEDYGCTINSALFSHQANKEYGIVSINNNECEVISSERYFDGVEEYLTIYTYSFDTLQLKGQLLKKGNQDYFGVALISLDGTIVDTLSTPIESTFFRVDNLQSAFFGDTLVWGMAFYKDSTPLPTSLVNVNIVGAKIFFDTLTLPSEQFDNPFWFSYAVPISPQKSLYNVLGGFLYKIDFKTGSIDSLKQMLQNGLVVINNTRDFTKSKNGIIALSLTTENTATFKLRIREFTLGENVYSLTDQLVYERIESSMYRYQGIRNIPNSNDKLVFASFTDERLSNPGILFLHINEDLEIIRKGEIYTPQLIGGADIDYDSANGEYHFIGYIDDGFFGSAQNVYFRIPEDSEVFTTSTADLNDLEDVSVIYPNPTSDILNIQVQQVTEIQAINTLGQMTTLEVSNQVVSTKRLEPGVYNILGFDNQGQLLMKDRFIKVD